MALTINLPSLTKVTDGSLQGIANLQVQAYNQLAPVINAFLQDAVDFRDTSFYTVGDIPTLPFAAADFTQQLAQARSIIPILLLDVKNILAQLDTIVAVPVPGAPTLSPVSVNVPDFAVGAPTISLPAVPSSVLPAAPGGAPSITDVALPDAPLVVLPAVPTFSQLSIPTMPVSDLPLFSSSLPQNLLQPPTNTFAYADPGYLSALADPVVAKLLDNLTNGGYGIDVTDEVALWNRTRDRDTQAANQKVAEVLRQAAATSFQLPQGSLYAQIDAAQQELLEKSASANREIALKRADLYVENRKFTIQQVLEYERIARTFYNAVQERALNFAKASADIGIAFFDASVKNYNAQLEAYKTEASVFASRIQAELAKASLFRAQIEAAGLQIEANKSQVSLYTAQLQGIQTVVDVYKSRLSAVQTQAEIQRLKTEVYRTNVQAYAEFVRAKEAEFGMYRAAVEGQMANVKIYQTQIEAYNAQVQGLSLKAGIQVKANEVLVMQYEAQVKSYEEQIKSLVYSVDAKIKEKGLEVQAFASSVQGYRAFTEVIIESVRTQIENLKVNNDQSLKVVQSQIAQVEFRYKQLMATVENHKGINFAGLEFLRSTLASSAGAINGLSVNPTSS